MKNNFIKLITVFFLCFFNNQSFGQYSKDLKGISIQPRHGKILILQYDSIPLNYDQIAFKFSMSDNQDLIALSKKYKRKSTWSEICNGIGWGFVGIWLINEVANPEFYNNDKASNAWRRTVVGTSFTFCVTGFLIKKSAKKQVNIGLEKLNY
jgi:hypothetical protein